MHTERFRELRKEALSGILTKEAATTVWRKIVRDQLRSLDIRDIYDHYDFNFNIEDRVLAIRSDILNGTYKTSAPLIYRIEKKFGVCRHMVVPTPVDALVLQVLVESLSEDILKKQPSENAYYSRDKHNLKKLHEGIEYGSSFREQWKALQKAIYKFKEEKNLLVVTDLSNYYDSISHSELRKVFVSLVKANEVLVDVLFQIIEGISWAPDYLPRAGRGLPTVNVEAIRLLAHSFLFEVDEVLKRRTKDSFVRWMDDLTIGVDTRQEAVALISAISDMLKSRGMALNLSKTEILTSAQAEHHFLIDRNLELDSFEGIDADHKDAKKLESRVIQLFNSHLKDRSSRSWGKVAKRYITVFSRLRSKRLLVNLAKLYIELPDLRPNLLFYLSSIGYSGPAAKVVLKILDQISVFDDISVVQLVYLITQWEIPRSKSGLQFVEEADKAILRLGLGQKEPSGFYAVLWFRAKYSSPKSLFAFLKKYENYWRSDTFLRRQATATLARLMAKGSPKVKTVLRTQVASGVSGTVSVANQLDQFSEALTLESRLDMYLFPKKKQRTYPLPKFLVLCSVLNSKLIRANPVIVKKIDEYVSDPWYRYWLKRNYSVL